MDMETITIRLNGNEVQCKPGTTLLQAATDNHLFVPSICYNSQLGPIQTCDTCFVEVGGELVRACSTVVQADMQVSTESPLVKEAQTESMSRILKKSRAILHCVRQQQRQLHCT